MLRIFCDFDGTASPKDIGNNFFKHFSQGKVVPLVEEFLSGGIIGREFVRREAESIDSVTEDQFLEFVEPFELDPFFPPFVRFCREKGVEVSVVSDGLDIYVRRLLEKAGLSDLPWYANKAEFVHVNGIGKLKVSFPHAQEHCTMCANCKCSHVLSGSAEEDVIVYVGDGRSDACPVQYADYVFAKRRLVAHCQAKNISYFEFDTFEDVQKKVEELLSRKRLKQRWEAVTARKNAYIAE